jgi:hypothetical protein
MQNIPLPVVSNLIQIPQPQRLGNNVTEDDVDWLININFG